MGKERGGSQSGTATGSSSRSAKPGKDTVKDTKPLQACNGCGRRSNPASNHTRDTCLYS